MTNPERWSNPPPHAPAAARLVANPQAALQSTIAITTHCVAELEALADGCETTVPRLARHLRHLVHGIGGVTIDSIGSWPS